MANTIKMRSSISDEDLEKLIQEDKRRNPSDFSCGSVVYVDTFDHENLFFKKNCAKAIEPIKKWL